MALSTDIRRVLLQLKQPEESKNPRKQKIFISCHGTLTTSILGQLFMISTSVTAMLSSPTIEEFFYVCAFTGMFHFAFTYQMFWLRHRKKLESYLKKLARVAEKLEKTETTEEAEEMKRVTTTLKSMNYFLYISCALQSLLMICLPIKKIRLPVSARELPFYHPIVMFYQVCQALTIIQVLISVSQGFVVEACAVFWTRAMLKALTGRLLRADTRCRKDIRDIIDIHGDLLPIAEDVIKMFTPCNGATVFGLLATTVMGTVAGVMGIKSPEILLTVPLCFSLSGFFCGLSDTLEVSSSKITHAVYGSRWIEAAPSVRKMLLLVILRSQRTVVMSAPLLGALSYPLLLQLLKDWYRLLQALLNFT